MSITPGGEIGEETHDHVDQVLVFVAGPGEAVLEGERTPPGALRSFQRGPNTTS